MATTFFSAVLRRMAAERVPERAAALAFHALLAAVPLLALLVLWGNALLGGETLEGSVVGYVQSTLGAQAATLFIDIFERIEAARQDLAVPIIGLVVLWFAINNLFALLRRSLAAIFGLRPRSRAGGVGGWLMSVVRTTLFGAALITLAVVQFGVSLAAHAIAAETGIQQLPFAADLLSGTFSFFLLLLFFAGAYYLSASGTIRRRAAFSGGVVAATLFVIATALLSFVFTYATTAALYGTVAPVVASILWTYYVAMIFLSGATVAATMEGTPKDPVAIADVVESARGAAQTAMRSATAMPGKVGAAVVSLKRRAGPGERS